MVNIITYHVGLEFYSVFTSYKLRFLMIIVQEIVNCRLVEFARWSKCGTSDWSSTFLRNTTPVKTNIIDIVLLTLLF